jgi:hypothetical protein
MSLATAIGAQRVKAANNTMAMENRECLFMVVPPYVVFKTNSSNVDRLIHYYTST